MLEQMFSVKRFLLIRLMVGVGGGVESKLETVFQRRGLVSNDADVHRVWWKVFWKIVKIKVVL
jgi:hypothetical protein